MTWAAIIKGLLDFFNSLFASIRASRDIELGERREREANDKAMDDLRAAIDLANADSVSDDEAFGVGGQDNDLSRSKPVGRSAGS